MTVAISADKEAMTADMTTDAMTAMTDVTTTTADAMTAATTDATTTAATEALHRGEAPATAQRI